MKISIDRSDIWSISHDKLAIDDMLADQFYAYIHDSEQKKTENLQPMKKLILKQTVRHTRGHLQENKSIYPSIYLSVWKPFWKRVYLGSASWTIDSEPIRARGIIVLVKSNQLDKNIETKQI